MNKWETLQEAQAKAVIEEGLSAKTKAAFLGLLLTVCGKSFAAENTVTIYGKNWNDCKQQAAVLAKETGGKVVHGSFCDGGTFNFMTGEQEKLASGKFTIVWNKGEGFDITVTLPINGPRIDHRAAQKEAFRQASEVYGEEGYKFKTSSFKGVVTDAEGCSTGTWVYHFEVL